MPTHFVLITNNMTNNKETRYTRNRKISILISSLLSKLSRLLIWLVSLNNSQENLKDFQSLTKRLSSLNKTRGSEFFLFYIKGTRTILLAYLSGKPIKINQIATTKDGIPKILGDLISKVRIADTANTNVLPTILTILYCTRSLNLGTVPDLTSVTNPGTARNNFKYSKYLKSFWSVLDGKDPRIRDAKVLFSDYHFSSKTGPNGHALWNSLTDLKAIPTSLLDSLKFLGGKKFTRFIELLKTFEKPLEPYFPKSANPRFRKISWFPDKEFKVRIIGILDYWSQTVLKPFHDWLFICLKSISQDCTFSQGSMLTKLTDSTVFYSIDLTAATDRFPIEFICLVLQTKFGEDFVKHWKNIMVGYPFDSKLGKISYSVGNPMGAYSSWSSFALAHHFLVYSCIVDLNLQWAKVPYCLLGDDIVIGHKEVAELYLQKVLDLGVDVSPSKTHISPHFFEFAKRIFWKGREITPFPLSGLKTVESRSFLLTSFLLEVCNKGWLHPEGIPVCVETFYEIVKRTPSRLRKKFSLNAFIMERIIKTMRGSSTAQDTITDICRYTSRPIPLLFPGTSEMMFQSAAVILFMKGWPSQEETTSNEALGELATTLVIAFTGDDPAFKKFPCELRDELIPAIPLLNCYGQVGEKYARVKLYLLSKDPSEIDFIQIFKSATLPISDKIFVRRTNHVIYSAAHSFGRELLKQIDEFPFVYQS